MKCVAIDDEPIALSIISNFCKRKSDIEVLLFSDPIEGIKEIEKNCPDLVFMDIEMNGISGLDLARMIPSECLLIITSAHANYAIDGFDLSALDFLHKPFSFDRFNRAVTRAEHIIEIRKEHKEMKDNDKKITIKVEYKNVTISTDQILYIESMDNYLKIHKTDGRIIVSQMSLKNIINILPEGDFIRVHRSYIVAVNKILSFSKKQITLISNKQTILPIGRLYASDLFSYLNLQQNNLPCTKFTKTE